MTDPRGDKPPYETKDTNIGALVMWTGLLFIMLGVTLLVARQVDRLLSDRSAVHDQPSSPLAEMHRLPPEPRLQVDAVTDLIRLHDVENVKLNNYAWIDEKTGIVRIPITRAMAILAERGLPSRKGTTAP